MAPGRKSPLISVPDSASQALGPGPVRNESLALVVTQGQRSCCTTYSQDLTKPQCLISRTRERLMALTHSGAARQIGLMPVNPHQAQSTQIIISVIIHLISLCLIFLISKMALTTLAS